MTKNEIQPPIDPVDGSNLEENSPNKEYQQKASEFIKETSLDKMLEIAEIARRKKLTEPPKWIIPDDI